MTAMTPVNQEIYTFGVDVGGTNTGIALVKRDGTIVVRVSFPTQAYPEIEEYVARLGRGISDIISRSGTEGKILGIGIGAPAVNVRTRCIEGATDLPWHGTVPLADMLERELGIHVMINNDANAAALGEGTYGCARGMADFIVLTLGTGVGSGIVSGRRLMQGARGMAGELGHVTFPFAADRQCGCGRKGCLQTVCSSKGMVETARRLMSQTDTPSLLRDVCPELLSAKHIGDACRQGDPLAREVLRITEDALGRACAEFAAFADPEAIVLFGGAANPDEMDLAHITEVMEANMLHLYKGKVKILFSQLNGAEAALLGAASLPYADLT